MENNIKNFVFNKKNELYETIKKLISKVSSTGDYNLFLHKAYDFDEEGKVGKDISSRSNMQSILATGLNLKKYSSIQQTTVYKGDLNINKADDIINYDYPWIVSEQVIVIVAMPFTTKINNLDIDFSTPIFPFGVFGANKTNMCSQYTMAYDALKYNTVQKEFILGAIVTNFPNEKEENFIQNGKTYELYLNLKHISFLNQEQQNEILKPISLKITRDFYISPNDDADAINTKIIRGIIQKDKVNYNQGTYESDFDFD